MAERRNYWTEYTPSLVAAIIVVLAFAILTIVHLLKLIRTRTWFCIPLVIGGLFEVIGFAARAWGNKNQYILIPYIIQALLILLAPILFAATVYMILSRIIRSTGCEQHSIIRVNWLTKVFVGGDVVCFMIQAAGGALLSNAKTPSSRKLGEGVILGGLIFQIIIFAFFLLVAIVFDTRMHAQGGKVLETSIDSAQFMKMMYTVSVLITVRNLFRVIEYAMGKEGYLLANEWPLYVFDATLMIFVLMICLKWYVGTLESRSTQEHISLSQVESGGQTTNQHSLRK